MAESTALGPAVRSTVMVMVPPGATSTGKVIQAPWLKELVRADWRVVVPSETVTVWRRAVVSQSRA